MLSGATVMKTEAGRTEGKATPELNSGREGLMRFVEDEPVRPACPDLELGDRAQEVVNQLSPAGLVQGHGIDHHVGAGLAEQGERLFRPRHRRCFHYRHRVLQPVVITLRVDDAELEPLFRHLLGEHPGKPRLPACRVADHQHVIVGHQADRVALAVGTDGQAEPLRRHQRLFVLDEARDQLADPFAVVAGKRDVGCGLQARQGVGHGGGTATGLKEGMVVLCVSDPHDVVGRHAEARQGRLESRMPW